MNSGTPIKALVHLGASYYPGLIAFWMVCAWTALRLAEQGVNAALIGTFAAIPWMAVLAVSPFVAALRTRLGWRGSYQFGNLLAMASVAGFATTDAFTWWCVWAAVSGVAVAIRWIVADAWAAAITPQHSQGRMVGAFETLAGTAIAVGPALVALTGLSLPAPAFVLATLLIVAWLLGRGIPEPTAPTSMSEQRPHGRWWAAAGILLVVLIGGLLESGFGGMLPVFGLARELTPAQSSLLMATANASALFLQWPVGWLSDRLGPSRVLRLAAAFAVVAAVGVAIAPGVPLLFAAVFIWGGVAGIFYTLGRIMAARQRPEQVVAVMSAVAMLYTVGAIVGPPISGVALAGFGPEGFSRLLVVCSLAVALFVALAFRAEPRQQGR